jgi:hypothetical protein
MLIVNAKYKGKFYAPDMYYGKEIFELVVRDYGFGISNYLEIIDKNGTADSRILYSSADSFLENWEIIDLKEPVSISINNMIFEKEIIKFYNRDLKIRNIIQ